MLLPACKRLLHSYMEPMSSLFWMDNLIWYFSFTYIYVYYMCVCVKPVFSGAKSSRKAMGECFQPTPSMICAPCFVQLIGCVAQFGSGLSVKFKANLKRSTPSTSNFHMKISQKPWIFMDFHMKTHRNFIKPLEDLGLGSCPQPAPGSSARSGGRTRPQRKSLSNSCAPACSGRSHAPTWR